jgi:hypothetical protein
VEIKLKYFFKIKQNAQHPPKANPFKTMSAATQMTNQLNHELSLYIPHVFLNFTAEYIANVFQNLGLGYVDHVDLVLKQDKYGKNYNAAYVHFAEWFEGPATQHFQERVVDPNKEARIIHDEPWYWIVLENKSKKREPGARKQTLDLSEEPAVSMIPIAPGLSQIKLSPEFNDEIDALIAEHFNEPMDVSCEFLEDELQSENTQLQSENTQLRSAIDMHVNHANECHAKMAEMRTENNKLHDKIAELTLALQAAEMELDEMRQENFEQAVELDEAHQENLEQALELDEAHQEIFILKEVQTKQ